MKHLLTTPEAYPASPELIWGLPIAENHYVGTALTFSKGKLTAAFTDENQNAICAHEYKTMKNE